MRIIAAIPVVLVLAAMLAYMPDAEAGDRPCRLWIRGHAEYNIRDSDGNARNNPDETLYPGDAFRYVFRYGFPGYCFAERVYPPTDRGAIEVTSKSPVGKAEILIAEANDCLGGGSRGTTGYGGYGSWRVGPQEERTDCGSVTMKISAKERHCSASGCRTFTKIRTDTILVPIVAPMVEVGLWEHIIRDPDNYMAANHDYTNYPWDPIAIQHAAQFEHLDAREGTITFRYDRPHAPLAEEGGFECDRRCSDSLRVHGGIASAHGTGFLPYGHDARNGGGMYAYTATSLADAGSHTIRYDVSVLNEGRRINTHSNQTEQLVVLYDPSFEHYEYSVLKDGATYAYDDRQATVIRYLGSTGSGPGDTGDLETDRRSKINAFYENTTSYSSGYEIDRIQHDELEWHSTHHINGTDDTVWVSTGDHAMFERAGYGVIHFNQTIADVITSGENEFKWYENTTTHNSVRSDAWAGHESFQNYDYTYQYPHARFANWFNMTSYDASGSIEPVDMTVSGSPVNATDDTDYVLDGRLTVMMDKYLYDKTIHDMGDEHFATAVVADLYNMTTEGAGTGELSMWMNRTGIDFYDRLLTPDGRSVLELDRYEVFDFDTRVQFDMTAGTANRTIYLTTELDEPYHEIVNTVQNEVDIFRVMSGNRTTSLIQLDIPEHFGDVQSVTINGEPYEFDTACTKCTIDARDEVDITVTNIWGGSVTRQINATSFDYQPDTESIFGAPLTYVLMVLVFGFLSYVIIKSVLRVTKQYND